MRILFPAVLLTATILGLTPTVKAQAIWDPKYPQSWPPGAYQPNDRTLPFSERYGYYSGPSWFFGMSGRQASYLEYLDRVDRAERFGRPIPPPPALLMQPPLPRRGILGRPEPILVPVEEPIQLAPTPLDEQKR